MVYDNFLMAADCQQKATKKRTKYLRLCVATKENNGTVGLQQSRKVQIKRRNNAPLFLDEELADRRLRNGSRRRRAENVGSVMG